MKKLCLILTFCLVVPALAISYLHVDGSAVADITPPTYADITADLAEPGNVLKINIFFDTNGNAELDEHDELAVHFGIIDGVPTIGEVMDDDYIPGDDDSTGNAEIIHRPYFDVETGSESSVGDPHIFIEAIDEDGSSAIATIVMHPPDIGPPEAPYIEGTITDSTSGEPIEGVYVVCEDFEENDYIGFTDDEGHYILDVPSAGEYVIGTIFDYSGNYAALLETGDTITVGADEIITRDFALKPFEAVITGRVTFSETGEGSPDIMMIAASEQYSIGITDHNGYYRLGQNMGATAYVTVSTEEYTFTPEYGMVTVTSDSMSGPDFTLRRPPSFISGKVMYPDSSPVPNVPMEVMGDTRYNGLTNVDGEYYIRVEPGTYVVRPNYVVSTTPINYEVSADSLGITDRNFILDFSEGVASVEGYALNNDSIGVEDAYVILLSSEDSEVYDWRYTKTDSMGFYHFDSLLTSEWALGSYKSGISPSDPEMYMIETTMGEAITDSNFVYELSKISEYENTPEKIRVCEAYPNPFNPVTNLRFSAEKPGEVQIDIYNELGQRVRKITQLIRSKGIYELEINASELPSGTYFYRVVSESSDKTYKGKITLIR